MKAIVLCAGLGTRLRPLTFSTPKHLILVANKPLLFFGIENLVAVGATDIGVIVSRESRGMIQSAVDDGRRWEAHVTYIEQPESRGVADAAQCAESFVGSEPFVMHLGNNLILEGLAGVVERFQRSGVNAAVMVKAVHDPSQFDIAELKGDRIVRVVEKPEQPRSNLAIAGGYVFDHNIFESIRRIKRSWRNEYEITDALQDLVDRGAIVVAHIMQGWWKDTGRPEDILEANREVLRGITRTVRGAVDTASSIEGTVYIGDATEVINSQIRGPVVIGSDARIIDSEVGPFASIGDRVQVAGTRIADSVVMEDCVLRDVRQLVTQSLLGRRVRVTGSSRQHPGARLLLGELCEIDLPD